MMNLKSALTVTTVLTGLVLGLASTALSECVGVGGGLAYNTYTKELTPVVKGNCKVATNVYLEPFIKFNKNQEATYGGDLNYRFVNYTPVQPSLGIGLESGSRKGYVKTGVQFNTPVILDVDLKVPFDKSYSPEVSVTGSYSF